MVILRDIHKKLKHLGVMQKEIAHTLVPSQIKKLIGILDSSEQTTFAQKLDHIRITSDIVSNWINRKNVLDEENLS